MAKEKVDMRFDPELERELRRLEGHTLNQDPMDITHQVKRRNPVVSVVKGVGDALKERVVSLAFWRKIAKNALPDSFSIVDDEIDKIQSAYRDGLDNVKKEIVPEVDNFLRSVEEFRGKTKSVAGAPDPEDSGVEKILDVFQTNNQRQLRVNTQLQMKREKIADKQFSLAYGAQHTSASNLQTLVNYTTTVNQEFQKRSLELQYRTFFTLRQLLEISRHTFKTTLQQQEAIRHNTALPDFAKQINADILKKLTIDKLFEQTSVSFASGVRRLGVKAQEVASSAAMGVGGLTLGLDQIKTLKDMMKMEEELGESKGKLRSITAFIAGAVLDNSTKFLGKKLAPHIPSFVKNRVSGAASFLTDPRKTIKKLEERDDFIGKLAKQLSGISDQIFNPSKELKVTSGTTNGELITPMPFDKRAHKSLVEIIPTFLSRIHQEVRAIRTGSPDLPEGLVYDWTRNRLISQKNVVERLKDRVDITYSHGGSVYDQQDLEQLLFGKVLKGKFGKNQRLFFDKLATDFNADLTPEGIQDHAAFSELSEYGQKKLKKALKKNVGGDLDKKAKVKLLLNELRKRRTKVEDEHRSAIFSEIQKGNVTPLLDAGLIVENESGGYDIDDKVLDEIIRGKSITEPGEERKKKDAPLIFETDAEGKHVYKGDYTGYEYDHDKKKYRKVKDSDINLKTQIQKAGRSVLGAIRDYKSYTFKYKKDANDPNASTHTGPMAQDLHRLFGDSVAPKGLAIDPAAMADRALQGVKELNDKVQPLLGDIVNRGIDAKKSIHDFADTSTLAKHLKKQLDALGNLPVTPQVAKLYVEVEKVYNEAVSLTDTHTSSDLQDRVKKLGARTRKHLSSAKEEVRKKLQEVKSSVEQQAPELMDGAKTTAKKAKDAVEKRAQSFQDTLEEILLNQRLKTGMSLRDAGKGILRSSGQILSRYVPYYGTLSKVAGGVGSLLGATAGMARKTSVGKLATEKLAALRKGSMDRLGSLFKLPSWNDRDESGRRDGDYRDQLDALNKKRKKKKRKIKGPKLRKASALGELFGFLKSGVTGIFSLAGTLLKGVGVLLGPIGTVLKFAGRGLGVAARGAGVVLRGGARVLRRVGRSAVTRGLSRFIARRALQGAAVSLLSSVVTGGVGTVLAGAFGAVAAVFSSPLLLGGAIVAGTTYGGYRLAKYFTRNRIDEFQRLRFLQYGFDIEQNEDNAEKLKALEKYLEEKGVITRVENGKMVAEFNKRGINSKEIFEILGLDVSNEENLYPAAQWFEGRFKPFFLQAIASLRKLDPKRSLSEVDKLNPEQQLQYLKDTKEGPYDFTTSPFPNETLSDTRDKSLALLATLQTAAQKELPAFLKDKEKKEGKAKEKAKAKAEEEKYQKQLEKARADEKRLKQQNEKMRLDEEQKKRNKARAEHEARMKEILGEQKPQKTSVTPSVPLFTGSFLPTAAPVFPFKPPEQAGAPVFPFKSPEQAGTQQEPPALGQGAPKPESRPSATPAATKIPLAGGPLASPESGLRFLKPKDPSVKIEGLNPELLRLLRGMAEEYGTLTGKTLQVNSAYRSREDQEREYRANPSLAARPGSSIHEYGFALDIPTVQANELEKLGLMRKYGLTRPVGGETWHVEPAGIQGNLEAVKKDLRLAMDLTKTSVYKGGGGYGLVPSARKGKRDAVYQRSLWSVTPASVPATTSGGASLPASVPSGPTSVASPSPSGPPLSPVSSLSTTPSSTPAFLARPTEPQEPQDLGKGGTGKPSSILSEIDQHARASGAPSRLLQITAALESSLNPQAKTNQPGQTAAGLYGFTQTTWQEMLQKHGSKYGIPPGTSPHDVRASTLLAGERLKSNEAAVRKVRPNPSDTDLYLAHFLGPTGAQKLLSASPTTVGADVRPDAAKQNRPVFYDKQGQPRTVAQIYDFTSEKLARTAQQFNIAGIRPGSLPSPKDAPPVALATPPVASAPPVSSLDRTSVSEKSGKVSNKATTPSLIVRPPEPLPARNAPVVPIDSTPLQRELNKTQQAALEILMEIRDILKTHTGKSPTPTAPSQPPPSRETIRPLIDNRRVRSLGGA